MKETPVHDGVEVGDADAFFGGQPSGFVSVQGKYVGTDRSGTKDLGNDGDGIYLDNASGATIGGKTAASRNVVSGNGGGLDLIFDSGQVLGNRIGATASGTGDLCNDLYGIFIQGPSDADSGKTRLALAVASGLVDSYEDGVRLVELAPVSDPDVVPQAVASVLGVRETPDIPLVDSLRAYLERREILLILDNCEHVIGACASLAAVLLRRCPNLRILATSREALGVAGETLFAVPPLSLPDPRRLPAPESLPNYEVARLFYERARALCEEGLELARRVKATPLIAGHLHVSAVLAISEDQAIRSARLWGRRRHCART